MYGTHQHEATNTGLEARSVSLGTALQALQAQATAQKGEPNLSSAASNGHDTDHAVSCNAETLLSTLPLEPCTSGRHAATTAVASDAQDITGELLAWQGKCRSFASQARHLTGQVYAERLRVSELSNKLAEREAEVERLLLRLKEVREMCASCIGWAVLCLWPQVLIHPKELCW